MRCPRLLLALGVAAIAAGPIPAQEWRSSLSYTWADNLSRTSYAPDRENAAEWDGAVTAEWRREIGSGWSALAQLEAGFEQVPAYPGIDSVHAAGRGELRRKFGLGPYAPVLSGYLGAARTEFHERGRSNWRALGGVGVSQRLTSVWRLSVSGDWAQDYARDEPFDVCHRTLSVESAWDVWEGWQLTAGGGRLWGELTANESADSWYDALAGVYGPAVSDYYRWLPWEYSTGFGPDWVAYRIDGHADLWWTGLNVSLGESTSLPLRYEAIHVASHAGIGYDSEFWSLSIVHRF